MILPPDIVGYVFEYFSEDDVPVVLTALKNAKLHGGRDSDSRMLRCALVASDNRVGHLQRFLSGLETDFRDVIVAGEYTEIDGELVQIRDLSLPFDTTDQ